MRQLASRRTLAAPPPSVSWSSRPFAESPRTPLQASPLRGHSFGAVAARAASVESPTPATPVSGSPIQLVEDKSKRGETDLRMNQLVTQTLGILEFLKTQGTDWERLYSKKGKQKAEKTTEDFLEGKKTDYKAELKRQVLKQVWAQMTLEEKLEMLREATGVVSQGTGLLAHAGVEATSLLGSSGRSSGHSKRGKERSGPKFSLFSLGSGSSSKKSSKRESRESDEEGSGLSLAWLNEVTLDDLHTLYEAYKVKRNIESKIEEAKSKVVEQAGLLGGLVGGQVGKLRSEAEFIKKCNERKQEFVVARKRYEFLNAAIRANKDVGRYEAEMDALHYSLFSILGPSMVYVLGELNDKARQDYPEMCGEAQDYLEESRTGRSFTTTGETVLKFVTTLGGLRGPSREEEEQAVSTAQEEMASTINTVANKSWSNHTGSIFVSIPKGVKKIKKALPKQRSAEGKLAAAQTLALDSRGSKSKNRDPITQIFYDAIADLDLADATNLKAATSVLREVGQKLGR